ncbi:MAG: hypothetical protein GWN93_05935 [Deltaproteobacteria bacterium]|nr:hypothetical protein [Deltaproteobacteria bacterium]
MKPIQHKTTRRHYEKYRDMAKESGVTLLRTRDFLGYSHTRCNHWLMPKDIAYPKCGKCWRCLYDQDRALNSVPLSKWDTMVVSFQVYHQHRVVKTLAEGVCMYKHLVIYEILGAEPVFDDGEGV